MTIRRNMPSALILFSSDSELLAKELTFHFDHIPFNAICVDNLKDSMHSLRFIQETKCRMNILFFSPDFLKFLECKPTEAFSVCGKLDSHYTLAIFCCGLQESEVLCYHMAPLKSYRSWKKFHIRDNSNEGNLFPDDLYDEIQEIVPKEDSYLGEIVVVPEILSSTDTIIYAIFSNMVQCSEVINVKVEGQSSVDICLENVNPYVMKFTLPDCVFRSSSTATVVIKQNKSVITKKVVRLSQLISYPPQHIPDQHPATKEELLLDEQLQFLADFSGAADDLEYPFPHPNYLLDDFRTKHKAEFGQVKDLNQSLKELCKTYGLDELGFFDSDPPSSGSERQATIKEYATDSHGRTDLPKAALVNVQAPSNNEQKELDMDEFLMDSFFSTGTGITKIRRSLSLPSTLCSPAEFWDGSEEIYMDMRGDTFSDLKPHERLLKHADYAEMRKKFMSDEGKVDDEELLKSISSDLYVSLVYGYESKAESLARFKPRLSNSQQELLDLMNAYKYGNRTISDVERQVQLWHERQDTQNKDREATLLDYKLAYEKNRKYSTFGLPYWKSFLPRKPNKKDFKNTDVDKEPPRKISNTSASSASSKASEESDSTLAPYGDVSNYFETASEDSIRVKGNIYHPKARRSCCPLYPGMNPPPLPSRPPPSAKIEYLENGAVTVNGSIATANSSTNAKENPASLKKPILPPKPTSYHWKYNKLLNQCVEEPKIEEECDDDEHRNQSLVELCQKYGLEELRRHFVNQSTFNDMQMQNSPKIFEECKSPESSEREYWNLRSPKSFTKIESGIPPPTPPKPKIFSWQYDHLIHIGTEKPNFKTQFGDEESKYVGILNRTFSMPVSTWRTDESSSSSGSVSSLHKWKISNSDTRRYACIRRSSSWPTVLWQSHDSCAPLVNGKDSFNISNSKRMSHSKVESESRKPFDFDNDDMYENSFIGHIYMSLERKGKSEIQDLGLPKNYDGLSICQQELLGLMHAFKRGEKTISQVEEQFKEWHAQHCDGMTNSDFDPLPPKIKQEKNEKFGGFGLPVFKNFILRKPKRKGSDEKEGFKQYTPLETDKIKVKLSSDASDTSLRRFSKISNASTSSGNSENSEVFRSVLNYDKEHRKDFKAENSANVQPRSSAVSEKKPPPLPPRSLLTSSDNYEINKKFPTKIDAIKEDGHSETKSRYSGRKKPILPPKRRTETKIKPSHLADLDLTASKNGSFSAGEDLPLEDDGNNPPTSPDYIIPDTHAFTRSRRKKAASNKNPKTNLPDIGNSANNIQQTAMNASSCSRYKETTNEAIAAACLKKWKDSQQDLMTVGNRKVSIINGQALTPETIYFLKKAYLWRESKKEESMFYIRRTSSYPDLRVSQPIYMELLAPTDNTASRRLSDRDTFSS